MLNIAPLVLHFLGATVVRNIDVMDDPTNEDEFKQLVYESPNIITWNDYQNAVEPALRKRGLRMIRSQRTKCLQESDYIMTVDFFNTLRNRDDWIGYRQALRDFPDQVKTIVWTVPGQTINWDATGFPKQPPIIKYS